MLFTPYKYACPFWQRSLSRSLRTITKSQKKKRELESIGAVCSTPLTRMLHACLASFLLFLFRSLRALTSGNADQQQCARVLSKASRTPLPFVRPVLSGAAVSCHPPPPLPSSSSRRADSLAPPRCPRGQRQLPCPGKGRHGAKSKKQGKEKRSGFDGEGFPINPAAGATIQRHAAAQLFFFFFCNMV